MDKKELKIQIALGTLPTAPAVLAFLVKKTNSKDLVLWALNHKSAKVRAAAVRNPVLSDYQFVIMALTDKTATVRDAVAAAFPKRSDSVLAKLKRLDEIDNAPVQLELNLGAANKPSFGNSYYNENY